MAGSQTELQDFLNEEVQKYKGIAVPVRATFLNRKLVKKLGCDKLHPNPDDEFCFPDIGPNYGIINQYVSDFSRCEGDPQLARMMNSSVTEPLIVEKIRPDGYMILNGHHRWAAALKLKLPKIRVEIVNLTQESDLKQMLRNATHDKRVTLDLDEVVLRKERDELTEKPLGFPLNRFYPEKIRLGIPALFRFLNKKGYDIWVYSANYYSMDHMQKLFFFYGSKVTGVITGTGRKGASGASLRKIMEKDSTQYYRTTLHIDNDLLVRTSRDSREFDEFPLDGSSTGWSSQVMDVIGAFDQDEQPSAK